MRPSHVSPKGVAFIARHEGLVLEPYSDPAGNATIGYGHLIHYGPANLNDRARYRGFTKDDATALLAQDLRETELAILAKVRPPFLWQWRFDALASAVFNLGPGILSDDLLGLALSSWTRRGVGAALLKYDHVNGVEIPGLKARREDERALFLYRRYGG